MLKHIKKFLAFLILGIGISLFYSNPTQAQWNFIRGDANGNGQIDPDDFTAIFEIIARDSVPGCADAADVNDDGQVTPVDLDYLGNYIFYDSAPPPPPFPNCGSDPTSDTLTCTFTQCSMSTFIRGDINCNGVVDSSDAVYYDSLINHGGPLAPCLDAADVNDDGILLTISDLVYLLRYLESGEPLPPPFPNCGTDPTFDDVSCSTSCCPTLTTQCNDGIDNDGDGLIDLADPFCCNDSSFAEHFAYKPGDFNGNGVIGLPDIIGLVGYIFKGGPYPVPKCLGDVNGNGSLTLIDIVYLMNYIYKGGPEPVPSGICCFPSS